MVCVLPLCLIVSGAFLHSNHFCTLLLLASKQVCTKLTSVVEGILYCIVSEENDNKSVLQQYMGKSLILTFVSVKL